MSSIVDTIQAAPVAGAGGPYFAGELVRASGNNTVVKAQADILAHTLGYWGVVTSGVVATGGPIAVASAGAKAKVLLETGLTPVSGQTLFISPFVAGRATNVSPGAPVAIGSIVDATPYAQFGYVYAVVNGVGGGSGTGAQGAQGSQGSQGGAGAQGNQGSQGSQGTAGSQGAQGSQGTAGSQGTQGAGSQGAQGAQGFQGPGVGSQGAQGQQGPQGPSGGAQGNQGLQGLQGATGLQGLQGAQGAGSQGAQGFQGFQGGPGAQGGTGAQGATGGQGSQGAQGSTPALSSTPPPAVESASSAGVLGTAARSDHTHALDIVAYNPSLAGMQASGVIQQTYGAPTATPVATNIPANLIPTGTSTGTGILTTIPGFGQYGALGVGPQVFLDASNVTPAAALLPTQLNVISEASFAISGASIGQYVNATTFGSRFRIIRSRGTFAAPTAVAAQDPMGAINFEGYSGSGYLRTADIAAYIDDTLAVDATHVPINVVVGQAGGQSLNHPIPATQVSQMWAYTGDVVIGFAAQVGALTTGYIWLRSTNDGPPTGVPVAPTRITVATGATACIIDPFVTATNQTGRFYGRVNGGWHFTQFDDYSATTAHVPFGGATAGTLVDSAFFTFTTATNALVVGGAPGGGTNSGSVKVFSGTNGIAAGGGQFMAVYATDQDATAHAVIGADNGFLGPNLIGWQNGALASLLVGAGTGQTLTLGYAASTLFGATEAAKIDGTTGTVTLGTLANIAGVTVQQNAAGADTRLGINTVVAGTVHGYPYIPTIGATPTGAADVYGNGAAAITYDTTDHGLWVRSTVGSQWEFLPAANSTLAAGAGTWVTTNLPASYGTTPKYWSFKGFGGALCVVPYFTNP